MKRYRRDTLSPAQYRALIKRPFRALQVEEVVKQICLGVKARGDDAVRKYTAQFDSVTVDELSVSAATLEEAAAGLSHELREAMHVAVATLHAFHSAQDQRLSRIETLPDVCCWRERRPIESVGLYVPAGTAPLPSTVLMLGIPAKIAGCSNIVLCSPPRGDGSVDPTVLAAVALLGIRNVYRIGGAQAIAAMAYGTAAVPKVDKIFGPGNRYVAAAKRFIAFDPDGASIDMVAGPSELLIIADEQADASIVAADLLSQAEHDPDSHVVLVTTSETLATSVLHEVHEQLNGLSRRRIVSRAPPSSFVLEVDSIDEAIAFSNDYAPEHLMMNTENSESLVSRIQNAGSVFLGGYAPVTAGDYASGTNHTLPTGGTARFMSGLSVESFQKTISFQSITKTGLAQLQPTLVAFSEAEGLEAHKRAVLARFD